MAMKTFNKRDILNMTKEVIKPKLPNLSGEHCAGCQWQNELLEMGDGSQVLDNHSCKLNFHISYAQFKELLDPLDILIECAKYAKNIRWVMKQLKILLNREKWLEDLFDSYN